MLENASTTLPLSWKSLAYDVFMAVTASLQSLMVASSFSYGAKDDDARCNNDGDCDEGLAKKALHATFRPCIAVLHTLRHGSLE